MAWFEVTSQIGTVGGTGPVQRTIINSDQVIRISENNDGRAVIWFAVAKGDSIQTLLVRERMDDIVQDIRNREAALASAS